MKDERLEQEFGEYFKGVETPDNITEKAKKQASVKRTATRGYLKYLSIAASSVLVCAVALALIFNSRTNFNAGTEAPDPPQSGSTDGTYADSDLVWESENAYAVSYLDPALALIENFAYADNARVSACNAAYLDGELAAVYAEITYLATARDDTEIVVEFTDDQLVYEPMTEYLSGTVHYYNGYEYYLTAYTAENGEPGFKLYVSVGGVKYYFNVRSSDEESYIKYLKLIAD